MAKIFLSLAESITFLLRELFCGELCGILFVEFNPAMGNFQLECVLSGGGKVFLKNNKQKTIRITISLAIVLFSLCSYLLPSAENLFFCYKSEDIVWAVVTSLAVVSTSHCKFHESFKKLLFMSHQANPFGDGRAEQLDGWSGSLFYGRLEDSWH